METPDSTAEREIFAAAAALPPEERAAYLDATCEGRLELRARVEAWLGAHEPSDFMQAAEDELRMHPEQAGERIGNYKLLEKIGEGGFGVVWVADQERPVRRRVALKIIKLGMDTKEVIARFGQERQALAMMDHPHIAKVLDAGATEWGRPYFVMELVRGIKITDYCDQVNLPTDARLALFIEVCQAVQHAHQKGIIHRDLKPSNILVTLHDGAPVPKVIDFGVAKATQQQPLTDLTIYTQFQQMIGTPVYMSPEQAEMSGLDIDTRSDIYSLGVLLYELLTGRTPFDPADLMRQGMDEIRRAIREREPLTPSTFLRTMPVATRATVAQHRQSDPAKLMKLVRRDVDWIVMKALEKDRARRYQTANGLAQDVRRFLAGEPVAAAAPSARYRFGKFARRNKAALGMAMLIASILVVATCFSLRKAKIAAIAEKEALAKASAERTAREEAEAIFVVLTEVFQSANPKRGGRTASISETLDGAVRKLDTLNLQPARQLKLQATLGWTYHVLDLDREAIPLLENVRDRCVNTFGMESYESMRAVQNLARSYTAVHRRDEAVLLHERVLAFFRRVSGPDHPETLGAMIDLGNSYRMGDQRDKSLQLWNDVLRILHTKSSGPEYRHTLAGLADVARSLFAVGRWAEATRMHEQLLKLSRKLIGPEHSDTLLEMRWLANSYSNMNRREDALKLQEECLPLYRKVHGTEHPDTLWATRQLVYLYASVGLWNEAVREGVEAFELHRKVVGLGHSDTVEMMRSVAHSYGRLGRWDDAFKMLDETLSLARMTYGSENAITMEWARQVAEFYATGGRFDDAAELLAEVVKFSRKEWGPDHDSAQRDVDRLARCLERAGRLEEALPWREDEFVQSNLDSIPSTHFIILQAWLGRSTEHAATCKRLLQGIAGNDDHWVAGPAAKVYCLLPSSDPELLDAALTLARQAVDLGSKYELPYNQMALGMAEYRAGNYPAADATLAAAVQGGKNFPPVRDSARFYHAMCLFKQGKAAEGRKLFAEAAAQMKPLPADELKPFADGAGLNDLILWMAYKEARALLGREK
jgi:eukaryotic-like serine/threonine-protein kinase